MRSAIADTIGGLRSVGQPGNLCCRPRAGGDP